MRNYHDIFIKCESVFHFFFGVWNRKRNFSNLTEIYQPPKKPLKSFKVMQIVDIDKCIFFYTLSNFVQYQFFCALNVVGPSEKFDWIDWVRYDDWGDMDRSILFIQIRIPFSSESTSIKFSVYLTENRESEFLLRQWVEMQVLDGSWNWKILALSNKMKTI